MSASIKTVLDRRISKLDLECTKARICGRDLNPLKRRRMNLAVARMAVRSALGTSIPSLP